jgi:hypothetical protein
MSVDGEDMGEGEVDLEGERLQAENVLDDTRNLSLSCSGCRLLSQ